MRKMDMDHRGAARCAIAAASVLLGFGCGGAAPVIEGNFALDSSTCMPPSTGGQSVPRGVLDVMLAAATGRGYMMAPRVGNPGGAPVQLLGFDVQIAIPAGEMISELLPSGTPGLTQFSVDALFGEIPAGGAATVQVEGFPAAAAAMLLNAVPGIGDASMSQMATVNLVARAETSGGGQTSSASVAFPLSLCNGCLQDNPNTSQGGPHDLVACPETWTGMALCTPQQDVSVQCCYDMIRTLRCAD